MTSHREDTCLLKAPCDGQQLPDGHGVPAPYGGRGHPEDSMPHRRRDEGHARESATGVAALPHPVVRANCLIGHQWPRRVPGSWAPGRQRIRCAIPLWEREEEKDGPFFTRC